MRVVHIITRLILGGAQENTILTCEGLHRLGVAVTLLSGPTIGREGSLVERARAGGYEFVEVPELVRAVRPIRDWRALRRLTDWLRSRSPDVVHTHSSKAGILGRFAAARAGVPAIVHTIHGMSFNRTQAAPVRAFYAALERRAARRTHVLIGVADAMLRQALEAGVGDADRTRTVYSGIEVERYVDAPEARRTCRAEWGASDRDVVVGTVARLFRNKGYEQLLDAMQRVAQQDPNVRFVWVGDGAQRPRYEAELDRRGLRQRTRLTGLVPPERIPALMSGFDLLAHPSQWEGLPRAAVQALLMRVPVVAFDIDGTPEVVLDGQTGRLVPLGDLDGFAKAILQLAADPPLRAGMGNAGRALCLERFDHRKMVDDLYRIYRDALDRCRAAGPLRA